MPLFGDLAYQFLQPVADYGDVGSKWRDVVASLFYDGNPTASELIKRFYEHLNHFIHEDAEELFPVKGFLFFMPHQRKDRSECVVNKLLLLEMIDKQIVYIGSQEGVTLTPQALWIYNQALNREDSWPGLKKMASKIKDRELIKILLYLPGSIFSLFLLGSISTSAPIFIAIGSAGVAFLAAGRVLNSYSIPWFTKKINDGIRLIGEDIVPFQPAVENRISSDNELVSKKEQLEHKLMAVNNLLEEKQKAEQRFKDMVKNNDCDCKICLTPLPQSSHTLVYTKITSTDHNKSFSGPYHQRCLEEYEENISKGGKLIDPATGLSTVALTPRKTRFQLCTFKQTQEIKIEIDEAAPDKNSIASPLLTQ